MAQEVRDDTLKGIAASALLRELADLAFGLNETLALRFMMASAQLPEAGIAAPSRPDITARGDTISACGRPRGNDVPTVGAASRQDIADHDD